MDRLIGGFVTLALAVAACTADGGTTRAAPGEPDAGPTAAGSHRLGPSIPALPSDEEGPPDESPPEEPQASEEEIEAVQGRAIPELRLRDFAFDPRTLRATAGQTFNLRLVNAGELRHNFAIVTAESGTLMSKDVAPGRTATVGFLAPAKPGRYGFACRFHRDDGMTGTLIVG